MSACISSRGEYSSHVLNADYVCTYCGVLDEDALIAELNRLRANQLPDGGEWLYGFLNHDGEFLHYGNESQARRVNRFVGKPLMRRRAWFGPVEPIADGVS